MFDITQEEDYRELTLEEQYLVNGGKEIENSIAAQADASVGDTVTDSNGKTSTLTQGDINWAQKVMAERNGSGGNSGADFGSPSYGPSGPNSSSPSKTKSPQQQTTGSSRGSKTGYSIDDENKIISADINDPDAIIEAFSRYYMLSDRGYAFEIKDGKNHVHTFSDMKYAANYVKSIDKSKGNFIDMLRGLGASTGITSDIIDDSIDGVEKSLNISRLAKFSKLSKWLSSAAGAIVTWSDIKKFINDPSVSKFLDIAIDGIGFIPVEGAFYSFALGYFKNEGEKGIEVVKNSYELYKDFQKKSILYAFDPSQQIYDYNYLFMKEMHYRIKSFFWGN